MGGVHAGQPRGDSQESLVAVAQQFNIGGDPAGIGTLLAIGRVVVRGLGPLRDRIRNERGLAEQP
jgi:hypothetical protein